MPTSQLDRYIVAWALLGLVAAAALIAVVGFPAPDLFRLALIIVGIAVAERVEVSLRFERGTASSTLIEAGLAAALLLTEPAHAVVAAAAASALAQMTRRQDSRRILYNVSQVTTGMAIAAALVALVPGVGPTIDGRSIPVALLGMVLYAAINTGAFIGILRRLGESHSLRAVGSRAVVTFGTSVGTTAVGIVFAALWVTSPELAPLLAVPAAAVHLAARGALRSAELLEEARTERDRLTRVVDGASDGILLLDRDGLVQVWNPAMERMTGIPSEAAVRGGIADLLTDTVREGEEPVRGRWLIDTAHEGSAHREVTARLRHADGTTRAVRESHGLVFDERGRCVGDVVVVRDVSRQEELERLRGDFVARVSHELRTPLTPIRGFASVLLRGGDQLGADQRREALESIVDRADHLGEMVEDLLLVTRVEQGDVDELVRPVPIDLREVIAAQVSRTSDREPRRAVTLHVEPGTDAALADPDRVRQILDALLDNACRYSPPDTPIEVVLDQDGDDVRVRVIDHGPGIPRDKHEVVFERFHRLEDPLTMETGGVGLGLFIARQLAEAMHGKVAIEESDVGVGAVVALRLPVANPAPEPEQAAAI